MGGGWGRQIREGDEKGVCVRARQNINSSHAHIVRFNNPAAATATANRVSVCVCVCLCRGEGGKTMLKREACMGPGPPAVA